MKDKQGILRGRCTVCNCTEYITPKDKLRCRTCNHVPAKHEDVGQLRGQIHDVNDPRSLCSNDEDEVEWESVVNLESAGQFNFRSANVVEAWSGLGGDDSVVEGSSFLYCQIPGCNDMATFDLNTRQYTSVYCYNHSSTMAVISAVSNVPSMPSIPSQPNMMITNSGKNCGYPGCGKSCYVEPDGTVHDYCCKSHATAHATAVHTQPDTMVQANTPVPFAPVVPGALTNTLTAGGVAVCAIPECNNPCFVDEQGKVFECCGYTHAMELQRRKAMATAPTVKGITHCLLPECNNPVWPFMNYCGRTHADLGKQRGLQPPVPQDDQSTKPPDCCIIPGCRKTKYKDSDGTVHPYCGKGHAEQGKKLGIFPKADQDSDQCDLPGCARPKRKEQDGTVHDYCCRDHANQDAPNRDAKILTPRSDVDKYLQKFSNLKVVKIEENSHAKPGGALFAKFKNKYLKLPKHQRTTQLAFHGTPEANIQSICSNGFDPSRRSGQAYGPGEYFAVNPNIPLGYCKGGKKLLLNELLLGQQGTHHTRHGDIVVMKDPAHDLPRFVITFQ